MDKYTLGHRVPSKKDFIDTADFDQTEIIDIIKTSRVVRDYIKSGGLLNSLFHKLFIYFIRFFPQVFFPCSFI